MINNVTIVGRLTKQPELRKTPNNISTMNFTLACDNPFQKDHTDFINCVAWNKSAEFLSTYANKGDVVGCTGRINTRSYDGQNGKVYVTEVVCDRVVIAGTKRENGQGVQHTQEDLFTEPEPEPDDVDSFIDPQDLPFY